VRPSRMCDVGEADCDDGWPVLDVDRPPNFSMSSL
jgi:hypothetical protein